MDESTVQFLQELKAIPNDEKEAYLRALTTCGELLYLESPVQRFIAVNDLSPARKARSFVGYWHTRLVFGDTNAFRPLQIVDGALTDETVNLLRSPWIWRLPCDRSGRPVCFLNLSHQDGPHKSQFEDRFRAMFYVLQVLSENDSSRSKGCVLLVLHDKAFREANRVLDWLDKTLCFMPIRLVEIHAIALGDNQDDSSFFDSVVCDTLKMLLSSNPKKDRRILRNSHHVHRGMTKESLVEILVTFDFEIENIPSILGGRYTNREHNEWIDTRVVQETVRDSVSDFTPEFDFPDRTETTSDELPPEEKKRTQKIVDSRHDKQKKQCIAISSERQREYLESKIKHLESKNKQARETNEALEASLIAARYHVNATFHLNPREQGSLHDLVLLNGIGQPKHSTNHQLLQGSLRSTLGLQFPRQASSASGSAPEHPFKAEAMILPSQSITISNPSLLTLPLPSAPTEPHFPPVGQAFREIQPSRQPIVPSHAFFNTEQGSHVGTLPTRALTPSHILNPTMMHGRMNPSTWLFHASQLQQQQRQQHGTNSTISYTIPGPTVAPIHPYLPLGSVAASTVDPSTRSWSSSVAGPITQGGSQMAQGHEMFPMTSPFNQPPYASVHSPHQFPLLPGVCQGYAAAPLLQPPPPPQHHQGMITYTLLPPQQTSATAAQAPTGPMVMYYTQLPNP